MLWLIICCAAFLTANCEGTVEATLLVTFSKQFRAPQPLSLFYDVSKETKIKLTKLMSKENSTLDWINQLNYTEKFLLLIIENEDYLEWDEKINIDQQIYFLTPSMDLYEKYTINNEIVKQKLGYFFEGIYIPEELIEQNFLKRRQNFHGSKLIALSYWNIKQPTSTNYFPSNETYVLGLVNRKILDIWTILQTKLNFTTRCYSRKDKKVGVPIEHPNGSISVPDGAIKDIMDDTADFYLGFLTIMYNRYLAIDYLVPLRSPTNGIFIRTDSIQESHDFEVFHKPFDKWTWTTLISSSLLVTVIIVIASKLLNQGNLDCLNFIDILAESLKANFGDAGFTSVTNKFHSLQITIFVALMMGNIIWIAYNGALLSKLVKPKFDKPFHDLKSLALSNYR